MNWGAGTLEVAGKTLEYGCWGPPPGDAPTLVMLHEGLGSLGLWRDWPAQLAALTGMGVLAYSRAGYGQSDPVALPRPLDYMTREALDVLGPLLEAASVQSCVLLGHSDGASIAGIYAGSVADPRVRGLILIAPHFFVEPTGLVAIAEAKRAFESGALRDKLARHHAHPDVAFSGWHDAWSDPAFADWNIGDVIDHWRVPVLVVQGDADPYGTLSQVHEIEERAYSPVETLILPGEGHAPHVSAEPAVSEAIGTFCTTLWRLEAEPVEIPSAEDTH